MNIRFVDTKIPDDVELIDKKAAAAFGNWNL